ncbi:MAG: glycosyltransferase [Candidatus Thorarchaeota archaeon]
MKVALVSSHRVFEAVGGVEEYTRTLCKSLRNKAITPIVLYRRVGLIRLVEITRDCGESSPVIAPPKKSTLGLQILYFLSMLLMSFVLVLSLLRLTKQEHIHIIHAQDPVYSGFAASIIYKIRGIPSVVHSHGAYPQPHKNKDHTISWAVERLLYLWTIRNTKRLVTTDSTTSRLLVEDGADPLRCTIQAAFLKDQFFSLERKQNVEEKIVIGYIGRLVTVKRLETLIEAAKILTEKKIQFEVRIVGDGVSRESLEKQSRSLGLEKNVKFLGWTRNVSKQLSEFDIFVLPSESEGSPISLLEAMASGKPCIVSNLRSLRELGNFDCFRYFKIGNSSQLALEILQLAKDEELRLRYGDRARKAARKYSLDEAVEKIVQLYHEIILNHS